MLRFDYYECNVEVSLVFYHFVEVNKMINSNMGEAKRWFRLELLSPKMHRFFYS